MAAILEETLEEVSFKKTKFSWNNGISNVIPPTYGDLFSNRICEIPTKGEVVKFSMSLNAFYHDGYKIKLSAKLIEGSKFLGNEVRILYEHKRGDKAYKIEIPITIGYFKNKSETTGIYQTDYPGLAYHHGLAGPSYTYSISFVLKQKKTLDVSNKRLKLSETLYNDAEFKDVSIKCEGKTLRCHKLVLQCQSGYFKGLLQHQESFQGKPGEISVTDTSAETMEKVLFYMYNDSIDESKIDVELLKVADKYLMNNLVATCVEFFKSNLTLENALDIMLVAYQMNQNNLLETTFKFACDNKGQLAKTEMWNNMIRDHSDLIAKLINSIF